MAEPDNSGVTPAPGDVLAGKYRVERVLGVGGMGVVVAARHLQLDERVALKFLLPTACVDVEAVARFVREARAAAKIKNEHVARVTDVGQLENGFPYMVMEYLEGQDLASWLGQRGALPIEQAVDFVLQACEALAEAHSLSIVHRDLKPANLFCQQKPDGSVSIKVLDFGISKVLDASVSGSNMTKTTAFLGSPLYMSPEQLQQSKGVDTRTDIWSLGIILYELVTGRAPFDANAVTELIIKIATEPAPMVRVIRGDAPPALEGVLQRCLQKDRNLRFQTVGELATALVGLASARGRLSTEGILGTLQRAGMSPSMTPPHASSMAVARTDASWSGAGPVRRSSGTRFAVMGGVFALGLIALAIGLLRSAKTATILVNVTDTPSIPSTAPAAVPPGTAGSEPAPLPPSTAVAATTEAASAQGPGAAPRASSSRHPKAPPAASTRATVPPAPNPNCDPPYTMDDQGRKLFKAECYLPK